MLNEVPIEKPTVKTSWLLNDRHFGYMQGKTVQEAKNMHAAEVVEKWTETEDGKPYGYDESDPQYRRDKRMQSYDPTSSLTAKIPNGESLADLAWRVHHFWHFEVHPVLSQMKSGQSLLISAHPLVFRALI
jgi:2,3-bisphosphoglycerate-dependent phosphoglycerate mutase